MAWNSVLAYLLALLGNSLHRTSDVQGHICTKTNLPGFSNKIHLSLWLSDVSCFILVGLVYRVVSWHWFSHKVVNAGVGIVCPCRGKCNLLPTQILMPFLFFSCIIDALTMSPLLFHPGFKASSEVQRVRPPAQRTDGDRFGAHILSAGKRSWHFTANSHTDVRHARQAGLCCNLSGQSNPPARSVGSRERTHQFSPQMCLQHVL